METLKPLSDFFLAIENDFRVSSNHIAIYMSLIQHRLNKCFVNPIQAYRHEITSLAKISSPYTYHKCIKELSEYGYIKYEPSFKKTQGSTIYFPEYQ